MRSKNVIPIYKPPGISPHDALKRAKEDHKELKGKKTAYAGKLDPLAEGVLLVLAEEELKNMKEYLNLDKEYEARILFGLSTDTYDILGLPIREKGKVKEEELQSLLKNFKGDFSFHIPPFSGYQIKKKPLFKWAREGRLNEINLPVKECRVHEIEVLGVQEVKESVIKKEIKERILKVKGDFRQKEVLEGWDRILHEDGLQNFPLVDIRVSCESGCYIRSLAHEAGKKYGIGACLMSLKRTRVGSYSLTGSYIL